MVIRRRARSERVLHRRLLAASIGGIALVSSGVGALGAVASATPGTPIPSPSTPKSELPANINPNKQPVLDPARVRREAAPPMTPAELRAAAVAWQAKDPSSRVVCFRSDGSVAGAATLDRVDPSSPLTAQAAAEMCTRGYPGSRP